MRGSFSGSVDWDPLKVTVRGMAPPDTETVSRAVGGSFTLTGAVTNIGVDMVFVAPWLSVTVSDAVYSPSTL